MPIEPSTKRLILSGVGTWVGLFGVGAICLYAASIDLALIAAVIQLVIMVLGIVRALADAWAKNHRALVISAFVILGVLGITATMAQSKATSKKEGEANARLDNALAELGKAAEETNRLTKLNTDLQQRLLQQGAEISSLATRAVGEITGADSWAYLTLLPDGPLSAYPSVVHRGERQLTNVEVRVTDLQRLDELGEQFRKNGKITFEQAFGNDLVFNVESLGKSTATTKTGIRVRFKDAQKQDFNIFFRTAFKEWVQTLHVRRVNGKVEQAERVFTPSVGSPIQIMRQCYTNNFPIDELSDAKDWTKRIDCPKAQ